MPQARASAVGLRTDNDENRQLTTDASFENWRHGDADAMQMMRMMQIGRAHV